MRTTGRSVQISNDLFNTQMIEPRILRVQPDPGLTIERLTGMHVSAGEIVMEIPTQIIPPAVIDRGHQATQQLNSNHTLRLLALIDTYRGPTRIQTSLVVPDQSDKPVPDQIDILTQVRRRSKAPIFKWERTCALRRSSAATTHSRKAAHSNRTETRASCSSRTRWNPGSPLNKTPSPPRQQAVLP